MTIYYFIVKDNEDKDVKLSEYHGYVVKRFSPSIKPGKIDEVIKEIL